MIVFFAPGGRLGNILFQYAFLLKIRKNEERIVSTQLRKIHNILTDVRRVYNSNSKFLVRIIDWIIEPLFTRVLVPFKIVCSYIEDKENIIYKKGILPLKYVKGYFQSEEMIDNSYNKLIINSKITDSISYLIQNTKSKIPVFLHVRRGDYLNWKFDKIHTSCLPVKYYQNAIKKLWDIYGSENLYFFIVGDDPEWCEVEFNELPHKLICRMTPEKDLALMSLCDGGVISNSTFAWWGWALCKKRIKVIGPEYWLGWKIQKWYPSTKVISNNIDYISVD